MRRSGRTPAPRFRPYDYGTCPSEPVAHDMYFHTADGTGQPIANQVKTYSVHYTSIPRCITALCFEPSKWQKVPRPPHYHGPWPPTSASQLMNTRLSNHEEDESTKVKRFHRTHGKQIYHECLGKYCWQNVCLPNGAFCAEENCNHTFGEWLTGASGWKERFELRNTCSMGVGLYSKRNWDKRDILGAYLGELIPERTGNTEYCHEVFIGPAFEKTGAPVAYIDAEHCGNYIRFCNHSCESNANISEERVGEERVLVLRAAKRIATGEQITIDYGEDYFRDGQCLCESIKCKYSNEARDLMQRSIQLDNRWTRQDSVLKSDPDMDAEM